MYAVRKMGAEFKFWFSCTCTFDNSGVGSSIHQSLESSSFFAYFPQGPSRLYCGNARHKVVAEPLKPCDAIERKQTHPIIQNRVSSTKESKHINGYAFILSRDVAFGTHLFPQSERCWQGLPRRKCVCVMNIAYRQMKFPLCHH